MKKLKKVLLWPFHGDVLALIFVVSSGSAVTLVVAGPWPEWAESILSYAVIFLIVVAFAVSIIKWVLGPWEMFDD